MELRVLIREGDEIIIELPGGKEVSVILNTSEDYDSLPELDVVLPEIAVANCWGEGLSRGKPLDEQPWSVECRQITIPIDCK